MSIDDDAQILKGKLKNNMSINDDAQKLKDRLNQELKNLLK
ncbi:hypothetical protein BGP_5783 [Beggiatoa sp. PS]|nr:hypothetical protein BGP_5783 [Beggiatoa sp. PS]